RVDGPAGGGEALHPSIDAEVELVDGAVRHLVDGQHGKEGEAGGEAHPQQALAPHPAGSAPARSSSTATPSKATPRPQPPTRSLRMCERTRSRSRATPTQMPAHTVASSRRTQRGGRPAIGRKNAAKPHAIAAPASWPLG